MQTTYNEETGKWEVTIDGIHLELFDAWLEAEELTDAD